MYLRFHADYMFSLIHTSLCGFNLLAVQDFPFEYATDLLNTRGEEVKQKMK